LGALAAGFVASSAGPFDLQEAGNAALTTLDRARGMITQVGDLCVPSEIPLSAPMTGRAQ